MKYEGSRSRRSILDTSPRRTTRGPRPELPKRRLRDATCARERSPLNGPPRAGPPWPRALVENLVLQCEGLHRHAPAPARAHAGCGSGRADAERRHDVVACGTDPRCVGGERAYVATEVTIAE